MRDTAQLIGYHGTAAAPTAVLLKHNGLHFEIQVEWHEYMMQHSLCQEEVDAIGAWLKKVLA